MLLATYLLVGVPLLSLASFASYWWDKRQAVRDARRTPESRLLLLDLLGGWPGGWAGQRRFRHKTRKLSYQVRFFAAVALHVAATIGLAVFEWG